MGRFILMASLADKYPHILKGWSSKNVLPPSNFSPFSGKKVWWVCAYGHEWEAVIGNRTRLGSGCPYCSGRRVTTSFADIYPSLVPEWHSKNI